MKQTTFLCWPACPDIHAWERRRESVCAVCVSLFLSEVRLIWAHSAFDGRLAQRQVTIAEADLAEVVSACTEDALNAEMEKEVSFDNI